MSKSAIPEAQVDDLPVAPSTPPAVDPANLGLGDHGPPPSHPPSIEPPVAMRGGVDSLGFVMDVPVQLTVEIGRKAMKIAEILRLGPGSVLELSKANGEPLDIYVNDRLVAHGEAVVVGERYGVRLTEVLLNDDGRM